MPRLSKLIEKAEDKAESKFGSWYERHKAKLPAYISFGIVGWYFYGMFINSIRLGIGNAVLPQSRVRAKLRLLDGMILRDAEGKLAANLDAKVKNSTAYTMATIFNCITESDSDLMVDPYLNSLRVPAERRC